VDSVTVPETADYRPNNIVQAGAKATAGNDGGMYMGGIEIDLLPGTCTFEKLLLFEGTPRISGGGIDIVHNPLFVRHIVGNGIPLHGGHLDRRLYLRFPKGRNGKIKALGHCNLLKFLSGNKRIIMNPPGSCKRRVFLYGFH
jgi:hypothetical protein